MSDIDIVSRTGTCAHCGPVSILPRMKNGEIDRWACGTALVQQRKSPNRHTKSVGHNVTEDERLIMIAEAGICEICERPVDEISGRIDHCHASKQIRGVLCNSCNVGLGYFKDDQASLSAAVEYLAKYSRS